MTIPVGPPSTSVSATASGTAASSIPPGRPTVGAPIVPAPSVRRWVQALIALLVVAGLTIGAALLSSDTVSVAGPSDSAPAAETGQTTEATVRVVGMSYAPDRIEVPAGDRLVITFENTGDQRHDLRLAAGTTTPAVAPGHTATLDAGVVTASTEAWCSLPGHRAMGMVLDIVAIGSDAPVDDPAAGSDHASGSVAAAGTEAPTMADLMAQAERSEALPAELPPLTDATTHEYTFTVTESSETVADGVTRAVWTYNGTSPGPTLHGRIGDTFVITLVNAGTMGHSIDFHAGELAPDGPMRTIEPGESLSYTFTAERAGVWMYHCGTMPMTTHIANGMFGAVVIEPDGLAAVDREYILVQSEFRLGDDAGVGSPDVVAFNGRAFQYATHPLTAAVGERVRFWVLNAGPDEDLAFHVVGAQFDTVWDEGSYSVFRGASTDGRTAGTTGAQVLPLMAAQGGFVEMVAPEAGHYAFVNHRMSLAERGAKGVLEVTAAAG